MNSTNSMNLMNLISFELLTFQLKSVQCSHKICMINMPVEIFSRAITEENMEKDQRTGETAQKQVPKKDFKKISKKGPKEKLEKKIFKKALKKEENFINPMDFWDMDLDDGNVSDSSGKKVSAKKHQQGLCVIGTDTGVGKTIAICALGTLLKDKGLDIAAMKPIECGGHDSHLFGDTFDMKNSAGAVSTYSFKDRASPYFVFKKQNEKFDPKKIIAQYRQLNRDHDLTFVEGAGGLLDPITEKYTTADLIKDLGLHVVVVAPLKGGVLNHLMMIADRARASGVTIQGVLFTQAGGVVPNAFFMENMKAVRELMDLPVIGFVPFLEKGSSEEILERCHKKVSFKVLLNFSVETEKRFLPPPKKTRRRTGPRG